MVWRPPLAAASRGGDSAGAEAGDLRVWCSGFIANRSEMVAEAGLEPAAGDREILGALYRREGTACARRIAGPLCWILLDGERGELFAGRDRAGTGNIYYAQDGDGLLVGERIGQVRSLLPGGATLNLRALVAESHGYAPLPGETPFAEIHSLEPGAMLSASAAGLRIERYWRLEPGPTLRLGSDDEYAEAFRSLLFRVLEQYKPQGASAVALSSGLDSTAVAAALRAAGPEAGTTLFTFAFPSLPAADESAGAAMVAGHLELPLEVVDGEDLWPLSGEESPHTLEEGPLVAYQELWDELYGRLRRRGIRVAFTGSGGDHLLGGSGVVAYPDLLLRGAWLELARQLRDHRRHSGDSWVSLLRGRVVAPLLKAFLPLRWEVARRRMPWLRARFHDALLETLRPTARRWQALPGRRLRLAALQDRRLPHAGSLMSLRAAELGIELRHPLTDHRLMELAASLPLGQCYRAGVPKQILRGALRGHLPQEILTARAKVLPFALFARGLKEQGRAKAERLLTDMRAAELGLVDERRLRQAYEGYLAGSGGTLFWHTLAVEQWLRRYA